jgi:hypothetical protein
MRLRILARSLTLVGGVLALVGCNNPNPNPDTFTVKDQSGNVVATGKSVPPGTTIEQCVDPMGAYMGEAYCPDPDDDNTYAVDSADPFSVLSPPSCICISAGDPGEGWDSVTTTAQIEAYDCAPTDPMIGIAAYTMYADGDGDGAGDPVSSVMTCGDTPVGYVANGGDCDDDDSSTFPGAAESDSESACMKDADWDGYGDDSPMEGVTAGSDCDDGTSGTHPGAVETCEGTDQDCDGDVDEDAMDATTWHLDWDEDGFGGSSTQASCEAPPGYVLDGTDCDDDDSSTFPGAAESDSESACMKDADWDGYGDDSPMEGVTAGSDCDDGDEGINPGAIDTPADGIDQDCEGGDTPAEDPDSDLDGDPDSTDCNDSDPAVYNGAMETCNSVDDDCDGLVDDGLPTETYNPDLDGDGYGASSGAIVACSMPVGYSANATDCNDADGGINPGVSEISFNGVDDNCDGAANTTASATITVTPNADQAGVSWELWIRDGTVDPSGGSTATWASGGAASGTGPLTGTVTVTNGNVERLNGPMMGYLYWAAQTTGTNVSTTITVNGYSRTVTNTCWDGSAWNSVGCPGTDLRWTVDTL